MAIERFTGTLDGRQGSFMLQHDGLMDRGEEHLAVRVIPGTGTGALAGLRGTMDIVVTDGRHEYVFEYTLP